MANPSREHWAVVKWVLRYLRGTCPYCITYNGCSDLVCGYVNLNFAGGLDKRRSSSGYVITLVGGPICWMSKLQNIVALSTTEAEYVHLNITYSSFSKPLCVACVSVEIHTKNTWINLSGPLALLMEL